MTSAARRRAVADAIDALDNEIATLQDSKRDTYADYREEMKAEGLRDADVKIEVEALKKSIVRRRKLVAAPGEVDEMDAKVDEIMADITAPGAEATAASRAPRVYAREEALTPRPPRPARASYQPPRMASPGELRAARRAGNPISQDFTFQNASIYFAVSQENGSLKIGLSNNVPDRLSALAKDCRDLELLGTIPGNRQEELRLLEQFAAWNVNGEWFRWCEATEQMVAAILKPAFDKVTGEVLGDAPAPAGEIAGGEAAVSPDTSEDGPTREDGPASPASLTTVDHLTRVAATTEVLVNGRQSLRTLPPRVPAPAPDWPEMPAGLDRSRQAEAAE